MTKKNLDYIIHKYADSKEFMRECLQVKLAYLVRRMIKKKAIAKEIKRKADLAEKKRIARLKELERAKKLHEERKQKKRDVRDMLKECVEILYAKEEKRRTKAFIKANKSSKKSKQDKVPVTKEEIPHELVSLGFN